jgi:hypothetical protein
LRANGARSGVTRAGAAIAAIAAVAVLPAGCGESTRPPPAACVQRPEAIATALGGAPGRVRLADGTPLSECVRRARADADLQSVGSVLTAVGDALRTRAHSDAGAAVRLGYLVGATELGGRHTGGIHAELIRRLEQDAALPGATAAVVTALQRGLQAGRRNG